MFIFELLAGPYYDPEAKIIYRHIPGQQTLVRSHQRLDKLFTNKFRLLTKANVNTPPPAPPPSLAEATGAVTEKTKLPDETEMAAAFVILPDDDEAITESDLPKPKAKPKAKPVRKKKVEA